MWLIISTAEHLCWIHVKHERQHVLRSSKYDGFCLKQWQRQNRIRVNDKNFGGGFFSHNFAGTMVVVVTVWVVPQTHKQSLTFASGGKHIKGIIMYCEKYNVIHIILYFILACILIKNIWNISTFYFFDTDTMPMLRIACRKRCLFRSLVSPCAVRLGAPVVKMFPLILC